LAAFGVISGQWLLGDRSEMQTRRLPLETRISDPAKVSGFRGRPCNCGTHSGLHFLDKRRESNSSLSHYKHTHTTRLYLAISRVACRLNVHGREGSPRIGTYEYRRQVLRFNVLKVVFHCYARYAIVIATSERKHCKGVCRRMNAEVSGLMFCSNLLLYEVL
jgi:hypothetical protein